MENSLTVTQIIKTHFKNRSRLARIMGIAPQTVQGWTKENRIPMRRAYQLSQLTGGEVTLDDLLPMVEMPKVKRGALKTVAKEEIRP